MSAILGADRLFDKLEFFVLKIEKLHKREVQRIAEGCNLREGAEGRSVQCFDGGKKTFRLLLHEGWGWRV